MTYKLKRLAGYLFGFALFYAPLAFLPKLVYYFLYGKWLDVTVHSMCFRIPLEHLLDGTILRFSLVSVGAMVALLLIAFFFGPVFCGRLCPAGAFTEYLSYAVPERLKIDWSRHVDIAPIRYGMLTGYLLLPFFAGVVACSYCNYYVFDLLTNFYLRGYFVAFNTSLLLNLLLWLVFLGLFTKGGRGYCNFLCPVGAAQNLMHYFGNKIGIGYSVQVNRDKCIGCSKCANSCPMTSIIMKDGKAKTSLHNCIICGECMHNCPVKAISYRRKQHEE